jgi:hypothetical protein
MHARNGYREEVIDVEKVSSGLAFRTVIFGSSDTRIAPNKKIWDVADQHFPSAKRKLKIFPLTDLALPIEPNVLRLWKKLAGYLTGRVTQSFE